MSLAMSSGNSQFVKINTIVLNTVVDVVCLDGRESIHVWVLTSAVAAWRP